MSKLISINKSSNLGDFYICLFKMGHLGPTPVLNIDMDSLNSGNMLTKMAIYYTTALGQGNCWHLGLYGPFPVPSSKDLLSLNYAFLIADPSNTDLRNKGKSYCILSIVFPRKMETLFNNRFILEDLIKEKIEAFTSLIDINEAVLREIKQELLSTFNVFICSPTFC